MFIYFQKVQIVQIILLKYHLGTFSSNPSSELNVLGHYRDPFRVDGTKIGVLKQTNKIGLTCFLKSHHSRTLESQIGLEILGDLSNEALEWKLTDQQFGGLLVTTDLS